MQTSFTNQNRASAQLKGIINLSFFGALWLIFPMTQASGATKIILIVLLAVYLTPIIFSISQLRKLTIDVQANETEQTILKKFNRVVALQWIAIFATVAVFNVLSLQAFVAYTVIIIVGLHFLPLAKLFQESVYYVTGAAMTLIGIAAIIIGAAKDTEVQTWPFLASSGILLATVLYVLSLYMSNRKTQKN